MLKMVTRPTRMNPVNENANPILRAIYPPNAGAACCKIAPESARHESGIVEKFNLEFGGLSIHDARMSVVLISHNSAPALGLTSYLSAKHCTR